MHYEQKVEQVYYISEEQKANLGSPIRGPPEIEMKLWRSITENWDKIYIHDQNWRHEITYVYITSKEWAEIMDDKIEGWNQIHILAFRTGLT